MLARAREYIVRHRRFPSRFGSTLLSFSYSIVICLSPPLPLLLPCFVDSVEFSLQIPATWSVWINLLFCFFCPPLLGLLELSSPVGDFLSSSSFDSLPWSSVVASVSCAVCFHLEFRRLLKRFLLRLSK